MARKAAAVDTPLPKVSVLERRLQHPFGAPSNSIKLREGDWHLRWMAESVRSGRIYQAEQLGWEFVQPDELRGQAQDVGGLIVDGRVVRGDASNREVLMKMPADMFSAIQRAKAQKNLTDLGSAKKNKEDAANKAASTPGMGEEAAEVIYKSNMEITDSRVAYDLEGDTPNR